MPFFDTEIVVRLTCTRRVQLTVEAPDAASAAELATPDALNTARRFDGCEHEWVSVEAGAKTAIAADFLAYSPESRYIEGGHATPIRPRGYTWSGVALWTEAAERSLGPLRTDADRIQLPETLLAPVELYRSGELQLSRHPGTFAPRLVALVKQMQCALLCGADDLALVVRLSTRECVGVAVGSDRGESNAPDLPDGWLDGVPYTDGPYTHNGELPLGRRPS